MGSNSAVPAAASFCSAAAPFQVGAHQNGLFGGAISGIGKDPHGASWKK
jgi:hypothetical protein